MARCIGVIEDNGTIVGFLIHNEQKSLFAAASKHFVRLMLQSGMDIVGLYLDKDTVRSKDCALNKLPRYAPNGKTLNQGTVLIVTGKMRESSEDYIAYSNVNYSVKQASNGDFALFAPKSQYFSIVPKFTLVQMISANPDSVCNMCLTKNGVLKQKSIGDSNGKV